MPLPFPPRGGRAYAPHPPPPTPTTPSPASTSAELLRRDGERSTYRGDTGARREPGGGFAAGVEGSGYTASSPPATRVSLGSAIDRGHRWRSANVVPNPAGGAPHTEQSSPSSEVCFSVSSDQRCSLCGAVAVVHCDADQAFLCERCDGYVHGHNLVVSRHVRTRRFSSISETGQEPEIGILPVSGAQTPPVGGLVGVDGAIQGNRVSPLRLDWPSLEREVNAAGKRVSQSMPQSIPNLTSNSSPKLASERRTNGPVSIWEKIQTQRENKRLESEIKQSLFGGAQPPDEFDEREQASNRLELALHDDERDSKEESF